MLNANEIRKGFVTEKSLDEFTAKITEIQADRLFTEGMIKEKNLTSLSDDRGVFEDFFKSRMENQQIKALQNTNEKTFNAIVALHSFGAGMLTTFRQREKGQLITEFSEAEIEGFKKLLAENDPYMMVCGILEATPGSDDKAFLDSIAMASMGEAEKKISEPAYLKAFAKVMFNAGITMASA